MSQVVFEKNLRQLIASNIRRIRNSRGIKASFMAKKLGYQSVSSYLRLESGESAISIEKAKLISDLLMVDINDFFYTSDLRDSRNIKTGTEGG